jgi:hypothetical protein
MLLPQEYQELYNQSDLLTISISLILISLIALLISIILLFKFFIQKREKIKWIYFSFGFAGLAMAMLMNCQWYQTENAVIKKDKLLETAYYKSLDDSIKDHLNKKVIKTNDKVFIYDLYQETQKYNEAIKTLN